MQLNDFPYEFRAWDKKRNEWANLPRKRWGEYFDNTRYIPMMFTGQYDKNGKPIFIGDVIQWLSGYYIIDWHPMHARIMMELEHLAKGIAENSIIIGNVFENPELMKE